MNADVIQISERRLAKLHQHSDICPNLVQAESRRTERELQRAVRHRIIALANHIKLYRALCELEERL